MRNLLLFWILLCLSCDSLELPTPDDAMIDEDAIPFFTIKINTVEKMTFLNEVKISGEVNQNNCNCIKELGLFYSFEPDALLDTALTYKAVSTLPGVKQYVLPADINLIQEGDIQTFEHTLILPIEEVDTTYFFRSYAVFDNPKSLRLERTYLANEEKNTVQLTLRDGWIKKEVTGRLWERFSAFAVTNPTGTASIVGTGCAFPSLCATDVEVQPFIEFKLAADTLSYEETPNDCPIRTMNNLGILNRQDAIAFWIDETIYFGTGRLNNMPTDELYAYNPDCSEQLDTVSTPPDFKARWRGIGFALDEFGYIGLGGTAADKLPDETLQDIWRFNPKGMNMEDKWCKCELTFDAIDPALQEFIYLFFILNDALVTPTSEGYAIIGSGINLEGSTSERFWKFTPNLAAEKCQIDIEEISGPPTKIGNDGISFLLNEAIYFGLGDDNKRFYKFTNPGWEEMALFPGEPINRGVGFALGNRGHLFTGTGDFNLSRDLWTYIPE